MKADKNAGYGQRQESGKEAEAFPIFIMIFNMLISKKETQKAPFRPIKRKTEGYSLNSCFFVWQKINYIWRILESRSFLFSNDVGGEYAEREATVALRLSQHNKWLKTTLVMGTGYAIAKPAPVGVVNNWLLGSKAGNIKGAKNTTDYDKNKGHTLTYFMDKIKDLPEGQYEVVNDQIVSKKAII